MDIFGIGTPELIVILVVALVVLGPERLPQMARTIGKGIYEFRKMSNEATSVFREVIDTAQLETGAVLGNRVNEVGEPVQPNGLPYPMDNTGVHPIYRRDSTARIPPELLPPPPGNGTEPGYTPPGESGAPATLWYPEPGDPNSPEVKKQTGSGNGLEYPPPFG